MGHPAVVRPSVSVFSAGAANDGTARSDVEGGAGTSVLIIEVVWDSNQPGLDRDHCKVYERNKDKCILPMTDCSKMTYNKERDVETKQICRLPVASDRVKTQDEIENEQYSREVET